MPGNVKQVGGGGGGVQGAQCFLPTRFMYLRVGIPEHYVYTVDTR